MIQLVRRELIYLAYYFEIQLGQILPYWILGIVIGSAVSVFGKQKIHQLFIAMRKHKFGLLGIIIASFLGIASPLCMYGTIPIAASFSKKGMPDDWLAAFMMSSILLNPQLLIYSTALGSTAIMIRFSSCFLCGIIAGFAVHFFYKNKPFFYFTSFAEPENRDTDPNIIFRFIKNIWRNCKVTAPYFILGLLLAALFQIHVSQQSFANLFSVNKRFGVFMAATIGVPVYMCGGGTIPLLRDWLHSGMSMGAATAFMLTGPATKITNLGAVKIVLGMRHFLLYLVFIAVFAFVSGIFVNQIIL